MSILIYGEKDKSFQELFTAAKILKEKVGGSIHAIVIGHNVKELAEKVAGLEVDNVYLFDNEAFKAFNPEAFLRALKSVVDETNANIVLLESNYKNKILGGMLASLLDAGLVVDTVEISFTNGKITVKRPVYAGKALSTQTIESEKAIIAIKAGVFEPTQLGEKKAKIVEKSVDLSDLKTSLVEFTPKVVVGEIRLEDAEVVVGAGRGIKKQEDLEMIREMAKILGGAWGVTRPLAADYGWAPEWIGISGISIKPKLYFAVGISGQPQHTSGIRESKVIVAINKDSDAPIFKFADYGIVGDLYQVLPELLKRLMELKGEA